MHTLHQGANNELLRETTDGEVAFRDIVSGSGNHMIPVTVESWIFTKGTVGLLAICKLSFRASRKRVKNCLLLLHVPRTCKRLC